MSSKGKNKLCWHLETVLVEHGDYGYCWPSERREIPEGIKRVRVTCSKCGRRLLSSIEICHDGCCVLHRIPVPHKVKGWWKKDKFKRKERRCQKSGFTARR